MLELMLVEAFETISSVSNSSSSAAALGSAAAIASAADGDAGALSGETCPDICWMSAHSGEPGCLVAVGIAISWRYLSRGDDTPVEEDEREVGSARFAYLQQRGTPCKGPAPLRTIYHSPIVGEAHGGVGVGVTST